MSPVISGQGGGGGAISGVTVTGTAASGQVPVASSASAGTWSYPPGFEIGYDQITSPVTVSSATEATGTTVITCGAHTFDGGAVLVTFFSSNINPGAADQVIVSLFESTTEISILVDCRVATAASNMAQVGHYRFTPTAGSHTYTVTAFRASVNGTIAAGSGGTAGHPPCFVRFTKV